MGYKARLDDGSILQPAVDVLANRITHAKANAAYKGTSGICPHCEELRQQYANSDSTAVMLGFAVADLTVGYVSAQIIDGVMKRIMHFSHRPNTITPETTCLICRDAKLAHHAAALEVIGEWAANHWPDAVITQELTVVVPGTPPERFTPDIKVHGRDGTPIACIEYQRSYESFDAFKRRHELRSTQYPLVWWFFDRPVYYRARDHRRYLSDRELTYFHSWVEKGSGQLIAEHGRPAESRIITPTSGTPQQCSLADIIAAYEAPQQKRHRPVAPIANRHLGLEMRGIRRPAPIAVDEAAIRRIAAAHPGQIPWQIANLAAAELGVTVTAARVKAILSTLPA
jgi:hypothetical protein